MMTPDDDLRSILCDAVSDVHPDPALDRIRRRTRPSTAVRRVRPWLAVSTAAASVAGGGGGLAQGDHPDSAPPAAGPASSSGARTGAPSGAPTASLTDLASPRAAGPGPVERALAVYYVGDTPQGPRLYREFQRASVPPQDPPVFDAVQLALGRAHDPDYRTVWPAGTQVDQDQVSPGNAVSVSLTNTSTDLRKRPAGMSVAEATAGVQQLVYTAQAAVKNRNPVRLQLDGKDTPTLLGVDVSAPVAELGELDVLALVSITDPAEGTTVRGSFVARGVASSFEATVPWQITQGGKVVKSGFSTADGWLDKLYPWTTDPIDISDLAPGSYTFVAMTDDPSSGEGGGPHSDTRTIVVRR